MRLQDIISIQLPAKTRWVVAVVAAVHEYAEGIGFDKPNVSRICLALEEAVCYAISLGYDGERDALRVALARTTLGLQMTVTSKGLPLNEDSLPQFDPQRLESEGDMTGIHSHLIRSTVDKAVFSILKGNRRKITLFKNLPIVVPAEDLSQSEQSRSSLEDAALSTIIRPAGLDDAESISRLALRAHGSLLFNADIYYPARVREMLEQGEMRSMVAETPQGEILGHGALVAEAAEALFEEITFGVVDRRLRGQNCSGAIADALLANAVERGLQAIFAMAVCNHVISQRSALHAGFRECALLLAASPASKSWSKTDEQSETAVLAPRRIANLVLIRLLRTLPPAPLFAPKRHRVMIRRIHEHLGMTEASAELQDCRERQEFQNLDDAAAKDRPATKVARIRVENDIKEGWAWIVVQEYGRDAAAQVEKQLRRLCVQGVPAIFLMLPLDALPTATQTPQFEDMGFFFSGVTFSPEGQEHLALQYINGDSGYDEVRVHSPFARQLLDYVQACDLHHQPPGSGQDKVFGSSMKQ